MNGPKSFSFYGMGNLNCFWVWEYCPLNVPKNVPNSIANLFSMFSLILIPYFVPIVPYNVPTIPMRPPLVSPIVSHFIPNSLPKAYSVKLGERERLGI